MFFLCLGQSGPQEIASPPAVSPVDTPVSIHARFFSRREAPDFVEAVGFAGDLVTTATANFAERYVVKFLFSGNKLQALYLNLIGMTKRC